MFVRLTISRVSGKGPKADVVAWRSTTSRGDSLLHLLYTSPCGGAARADRADRRSGTDRVPSIEAAGKGWDGSTTGRLHALARLAGGKRVRKTVALLLQENYEEMEEQKSWGMMMGHLLYPPL